MTPLEEVASLGDVRVDVAVELDRRLMTVREILALHANSVIEMPRSAGENIDIYVGDSLVGFGEIVIIESTMGFRITDFRTEQ
jgi:flagellar motor switch protein FliN/FliY